LGWDNSNVAARIPDNAAEAKGEHGHAFAYKTVNTDVLAWITGRLTGQSLST
jgi:CubicO group peptidase (beta-lactamase class C family)